MTPAVHDGGMSLARPLGALRAAAVGSALLALTGCALVPLASPRGGPDRSPAAQEWQHDPDTDLHYRPDAVSTDVAVIRARLPRLDATAGTWVEAQQSDPVGREVLPAPDDYTWQAVAVVGPQKVDELLVVAADPSDGGGHPPPDQEATIDDPALSAQVLPPIEAAAGSCPAGWQPVHVGESPGQPLTAETSDWISLSVVCPGGDRVVVASHDT